MARIQGNAAIEKDLMVGGQATVSSSHTVADDYDLIHKAYLENEISNSGSSFYSYTFNGNGTTTQFQGTVVAEHSDIIPLSVIYIFDDGTDKEVVNIGNTSISGTTLTFDIDYVMQIGESVTVKVLYSSPTTTLVVDSNRAYQVGVVGEVIIWPMDTLPANFLPCNGDAVSRDTYSELFATLGVTYGDGDGSTTFNLPDMRGRVLRGVDGGAGLDPDAATRTDRGDGTTGDNVGTTQGDELGSHTHDTAFAVKSQATAGSLYAEIQGGTNGGGAWNYDWPINVQNTGGNETRMKNINVLYGIRFAREEYGDASIISNNTVDVQSTLDSLGYGELKTNTSQTLADTTADQKIDFHQQGEASNINANFAADTITVVADQAGRYIVQANAVGMIYREALSLKIKRNGIVVGNADAGNGTSANEIHQVSQSCQTIIDMNVGDYLELYASLGNTGATTREITSASMIAYRVS